MTEEKLQKAIELKQKIEDTKKMIDFLNNKNVNFLFYENSNDGQNDVTVSVKGNSTIVSTKNNMLVSEENRNEFLQLALNYYKEYLEKLQSIFNNL